MLFILGPDGLSPLPVISQHLLCKSYPDPPPWRSYPQLELLCRNLLIREWEEATPNPAVYPYCPSLRPYPFMGLDKITAGRIHQMRSGKSYLRAHLSWDKDAPTTCPSCDKTPDSFEHAILHSSAKRPARTRHLQGVPTLALTPPSGPQPHCLGPSPVS